MSVLPLQFIASTAVESSPERKKFRRKAMYMHSYLFGMYKEHSIICCVNNSFSRADTVRNQGTKITKIVFVD
jgi:hypothetical protein